MKNILFILFILFSFLFSNAQNDPEKPNFELNLYGLFRAHLAAFGEEAEIQDASPRAGFRLDYHFGEDNRFAVFFGTELGINLINNQFNFSADPNGDATGFTVLEFKPDQSTFTTRLGFIGVDFDKYGLIKFGKVKSVYMDVAAVSDIFNVMSGQASYVYSPEGSDGGQTGTGRAESTIIYRNSYNNFDLGLQTTIVSQNGSNFFDGYAISLRYHLNKNITAGLTYNKAILERQFKELVNLHGLDGDPEYFATSITYATNRFFLTGLFTLQRNGDFANTYDFDSDTPIIDRKTVVYPGKGYELVGSYFLLKNKLLVLGGFNYKKAESDLKLLPNNFRKRFYLIGLQYYFIKHASVYSEVRIEDSINALGIKPDNVFMVGLRLDFNKLWQTNIDFSGF